ncbi:hypothetical protein ADUPG1_005115, partial [Aduncisulcus paluster]
KKKMAEEVAQKAAEQTAEDIKAMGEVSERTTEVPDDKKTATPEKHSTPQATEGKNPGKARRASVKEEEESNEDLGGNDISVDQSTKSDKRLATLEETILKLAKEIHSMKKDKAEGDRASVSHTPQVPLVVVTQDPTPPPMLEDTTSVKLREWATRLDVHIKKTKAAPALISCTASGTSRKLQEILRDYIENPTFSLSLTESHHTRMVVTAILDQKVTSGSALETKVMREAKKITTRTKMSETEIEN